MKINSEKLYDFINNLGTDEKVRFKVFYDDNYVTEIYWDGENFRWEAGTFTTGALFNPLYDFVEIEEEKKIPEKLEEFDIQGLEVAGYSMTQAEYLLEDGVKENRKMINLILDYLKNKGDE